MNTLDQIKEITLTRKNILASSKRLSCMENFSFLIWICCSFKTMFSMRYNTCLICQTELDEDEKLYDLNP